MRVALLTYRGNPFSGGQGVYVRYLSRALARLGHDVTVVSGPPYPVLDGGVRLVRVPSLGLYRPEDPFRPERASLDAIDRLETVIGRTGGYPEPLTFSLRAARLLDGFDVVHDNQVLATGIATIARRIPTLATIHHPITIDRDIALRAASTRLDRLVIRRWNRFTRMQARVARRLRRVLTVSRRAAQDIVDGFGVPPQRIAIAPVGVDASLFRPLPAVRRVPGRIVTTASADIPLKGLPQLLEAVAKLRTERPVELVVIGGASPDGPGAHACERLGLAENVTFLRQVRQEDLPAIYAQASVAVVPSLYEGFSLPALEAMACGVPLVATSVGALPEILDGGGGVLVEPGHPEALAAALAGLLDGGTDLGGRDRVLDRYTWDACARATAVEYERVVSWGPGLARGVPGRPE